MIFNSMKNKMTLAVSLLVIVLLGITASTAFLYFQDEYKKTVARDQFTLLSAAATQIDERLFEALVSLDDLADGITPELLGNPGKAERFLREHATPTNFFTACLTLLSRSGEVIASPMDPGLKGKDLSYREYFKSTVETGRICISSPIRSVTSDGKPLIMFTTPVYDRKNRLIGVLAGGIYVKEQHYIRQLAALKLGQKGYLTLYDENGAILMHPDQEKVLQHFTERSGILNEALQGFEGSRERVDADGVPVLTSVKKLKSTGWVLAASYPLSVAYAPIRTATEYFLIVGVLALVGSMLLVWSLMSYLTTPLQLFTRHIKELPSKEGAGKLFPVHREDEVGTLARAFNELLGHLEQEQRERQEQKEFAENLVNNSSLPSFVIDTSHRVIFWNRACEDLTGIGKSEVIGSDRHQEVFYGIRRPTIADFVAEGKTEELSAWYDSFSRSPFLAKSWCSEGWLCDLNGSDRYVVSTAAPIFNGSGDLIAVIETLQDMTERKLSEEAQRQAYELLRESEEKYMRVVNNIPVGVAIVSPKMEILSTNPLMKKWFPLAEARQRPMCYEIFNDPPRETTCDGCPTVKTLRDGEVHETMKESITQQGVRSYKVVTSPIKSLEGEVIAAVEMVQDLTEQKKLEQQLRQAQKMEAIGTLAGGIAHDFNNILTAISAYCSLIDRHLDSAGAAKNYLNKLISSAERATALTRSLLAYSRNQPLNRQPVDLNAVAVKVEHLLSRLLSEDIELAMVPGGQELMVMADSLQIEQVLINLCTNARDAMPDGGILRIVTDRIDVDADFIKTHGYGEPGRHAVLTVSDTGCGIDEGTRDRIFEPFFTTKEVGKGTGLGLSIVYGIVKQHNGHVSVYSEPGKGTTFTIYLPTIEDAPNPRPGALELPCTRGDETILLVEDDAEIRATLKELLEAEGYRIIEAVDGVDGVEKFRSHLEEIDFVIIDVVMPRMNGRAAHDEIRALRPEIKSLFISGYTADILQVKGVLQEDVNFISKPVHINNLLVKMRGVLDC